MVPENMFPHSDIKTNHLGNGWRREALILMRTVVNSKVGGFGCSS